MPKPSGPFCDALKWSEEAARTLSEMKGRQRTLEAGYANLVATECRCQEDLAEGNKVGDSNMREEVAQQLVMAAAGIDVVGADGSTAASRDQLQRSRTRRRYEKRVHKAQAKGGVKYARC